jgi:hypothetical protein
LRHRHPCHWFSSGKTGFVFREDKRQVAYPFYLIRWYNGGGRFCYQPSPKHGNLDLVVDPTTDISPVGTPKSCIVNGDCLSPRRWQIIVGKGPKSKFSADAIIEVIRLRDQVVIVPPKCQEPVVL